MNVSVLGTGRWGTFLAYQHSKNHSVTLWGRENSRSYSYLVENRKNEYLNLPDDIQLTNDLEEALKPQYIVISISAQQLRSLAKQINAIKPNGKTFILCMKGLEENSGKRLTEVMHEEIEGDNHVAVWVGPGHVQDFCKDIPNCMVVDCENPEVTDDIVDKFNSELIRLYKGCDIVGTELGAAAKNVVGIAAGMLDGLNNSSLKGALMARGSREIARLMHAMGANELSAYGLCHLGDYEATLFSKHSQNRLYGEMFIKGEKLNKLAEGVPTVKALIKLGEKFEVDLPICETIYTVIYGGSDAKETVYELFKRSVKEEFYK